MADDDELNFSTYLALHVLTSEPGLTEEEVEERMDKLWDFICQARVDYTLAGMVLDGVMLTCLPEDGGDHLLRLADPEQAEYLRSYRRSHPFDVDAALFSGPPSATVAVIETPPDPGPRARWASEIPPPTTPRPRS